MIGLSRLAASSETCSSCGLPADSKLYASRRTQGDSAVFAPLRQTIALCPPCAFRLIEHLEAFYPRECIDCGEAMAVEDRKQGFRTCEGCAAERRATR